MVTPMFVDEQKAADILKKPVRTLRQWRYTNYGPPYHKVGGRVRYIEGDLIAWLWGKRIEPTRAGAQL